MSENITDSRFHMWRAVVALVHADHKVTPEEKDLAESYFEHVAFSPEQKAALQEDLLDPQSVEEMFNAITEPQDQSEFFGFARLMVWCDGDLDRQEDEIFNRLNSVQMSRIDPEALKNMVRETRKAFDIERLQEDAAFQQEAKDLVSLGRLLDVLKRNPEVNKRES